MRRVPFVDTQSRPASSFCTATWHGGRETVLISSRPDRRLLVLGFPVCVVKAPGLPTVSRSGSRLAPQWVRPIISRPSHHHRSTLKVSGRGRSFTSHCMPLVYCGATSIGHQAIGLSALFTVGLRRLDNCNKLWQVREEICKGLVFCLLMTVFPTNASCASLLAIFIEELIVPTMSPSANITIC